MSHSKKKNSANSQTIANNKKAHFNYEILEEIEVGICLLGTEVKSLRLGKCTIVDSHAGPENSTTETGRNETSIYLFNLHISEYDKAGKFNHHPTRKRKLLLKAREIKKLSGRVREKGLTLVPLSLYFNKRGIVKVKLGLGKGKAKHDKRDSVKERDWNRQKQRIMKEK